jgi:superkiller protein 3
LETLARDQRAELAGATTKEDSLLIEEQIQYTLEEAVKVYRRAIEAHPEDKDFVYNLGVLYAQERRDFQSAAPLFQQVTEMDPEDVDAWFNLATALLAIGDLDGALPSLEKVIELDPNSSDAWYQLGIIYIKKGMKSEGEEAFKRAEELQADEG